MKTLKPGERYMTILVNKSTEQRHVELIAKASLRPTIVFADQHGKIAGNTLTIASEETLVILWTPTIAGLRTRIQEPPPKEM